MRFSKQSPQIDKYAYVVGEQTIPKFCPNDPSVPTGCGDTAGEKGIKDLCLSEGLDQSDQIPPDLTPSIPCRES